MRCLLILIGLLSIGSGGPGPDARAEDLPATPVTEFASSHLAGDALPFLPPGEAGALDVIAVGAPEEWSVPIVLRNNTDEAQVLTNIHGTASGATGEVIATGEPGAFMSPSVLPPGQVAIAVVYFNSSDYLPADAVFAFEVEFAPQETARVFRQDLAIADAVREADGIVGLARNGSNERLVGKVNVVSVCVDATGTITEFAIGFADALDLEPGETVPVEVPVVDTAPCEAFLVGANGYLNP